MVASRVGGGGVGVGEIGKPDNGQCRHSCQILLTFNFSNKSQICDGRDSQSVVDVRPPFDDVVFCQVTAKVSFGFNDAKCSLRACGRCVFGGSVIVIFNAVGAW